jgi:hypothetical protein
MGAILTPFASLPAVEFEAALTSNDAYYMFASRSYPWPDDNNPPGVIDSYQEAFFLPMSEMLFGKRLQANNIAYMINRNTWTSNTVYAQYDHTDAQLFSKKFFIVTDDNNVYKCLFNNRGAVSVSKPTLAQNTSFQTADGYIWKYMFTIDSTSMTTFGSTNFIPIVSNTDVQESATQGIDVIDIIAGGNGYITSTNGVIRSVNSTNNYLIQIDTNARAESNFYNNCTIYITNGSAQGQHRKIITQTSNSSGNWVLLSANIANIVTLQTTYEINPTVVIRGDGNNAVAICRTSNGVISQVFMANTGNAAYTRATITIECNNSYGGGANLIAYIPPPFGHGWNPLDELGSNTMCITTSFINNEGDTIPTECEFRTVGILKTPVSANNSSEFFTGNTYSQVTRMVVSPVRTFTPGNYVIGRDTGATGHVVFSNNSLLMLTGDKTFSSTEFIDEYFANGSLTGVNSDIFEIDDLGALYPYSGEILYLLNMSPISRSNTDTEVVKLTITF